MPLYLGLDSSTQSLTALLLEVDAPVPGDASGRPPRVVFEDSISFDDELPGYGTRHGVLPADDPAVAASPPLMWVEALDRMMSRLSASGIDLSRLAAISGSAQQHGSVYLNGHAAARLARLDASRPLAGQLGGVLSRPVAPIWMDASTSAECREISAALGGAERLAQLTGSRAFERFTGPQIRKFFKHEPDAWAATDRVHLVSSFLASLLVGAHAPLDPGDASGMNLMDLATRRWLPEALDATAPGLAAKLPPIVPAKTPIGRLALYWRLRYGLPAARVVVWSGDNPSSLIGSGLVREGQVAVSLGTSDTVFGVMQAPRVDRSGTGHVFGAPTGDYMGLTCFRNGSLARERIRDQHGLDWEGFSAALRATPPGNLGALMLPWFEPEITPHVAQPGVHRLGLDRSEAARNVRAVVEAQMLAMASHSRWMGVDFDAIHATGGAAANRDILQIMADVFGVAVRRLQVGNSACLGAALRAYHAEMVAGLGDPPPDSGTHLADHRQGEPGEREGRYVGVDWDLIVQGIAEPTGEIVAPDPAAVEVYRDMAPRYAELERGYRSPDAPTGDFPAPC
jgi:xylulokinase